MEKAKIIAEVGECFNGDLKTARKLISVASEAGCDYVKFQTLDRDAISETDHEKEWFKKVSLSTKTIKELAAYAKRSGIKILFTPENVKTAQWLLDLGIREAKIASTLMHDRKLLKFLNKNFKRVFISTGMATFSEVKQAVKLLSNIKELYIMHCISEYPTGPLLKKRGLVALSPADVRLNMMRMLMKAFPDKLVGYSDHTDGMLAPVIAVAMGARVIEKHITLDKKTPMRNFESGGKYLGTDHVLSLEPPELIEMVKQIREAESMLGAWKWERSAGENILKSFLRSRFSAKVTDNEK